MRWLSGKDVGGKEKTERSTSSGSSSDTIDTANIDVDGESTELPQSATHVQLADRVEGNPRFSLFRRRRSELGLENRENEQTEVLLSGTSYEETSIVDDASLHHNESSNDGSSSRLDKEMKLDIDQFISAEEKGSRKVNGWLGLFSNKPSSRDDEEQISESTRDHQATLQDEDESLNGVADTDHNAGMERVELQREKSDSITEVDEDSTRKFNWFGLMQPMRNAGSHNGGYESVANIVEDEQGLDGNLHGGEKKEEVGVCLQCAFDGESTAEVTADPEREEQLHSIDNVGMQNDVDIHVIVKDSDESEFFIKNEASPSDEIFSLWQRRQRLKRKLQISCPTIDCEKAPASIKMLGTSQMEVGGGRNEENLRSLELEAHLIDTKSDRKMMKMETMLAEEKVREDLLYDMWLEECLFLSGEEPEDNYDHLGWYSSLTQREDGEPDLERMDSFVMNVETENDASDKKSNPWLDGLGNAALFIFAPDLYFIQRMNESSLETQYHVTSNKEDGEQDTSQKQGWFRKMFTN